jgi:hypothetical protein
MWLTDELQVLEVRPSIMWDKGKAVEFLLQSLGKCHAVSSIFVLVDHGCFSPCHVKAPSSKNLAESMTFVRLLFPL